MSNLTVLACDTAAKAAQAQQFLIDSGFAPASITSEQVAVFSYDAAKYDGGTAEILANKFIVIGRK